MFPTMFSKEFSVILSHPLSVLHSANVVLAEVFIFGGIEHSFSNVTNPMPSSVRVTLPSRFTISPPRETRIEPNDRQLNWDTFDTPYVLIIEESLSLRDYDYI